MQTIILASSRKFLNKKIVTTFGLVFTIFGANAQASKTTYGCPDGIANAKRSPMSFVIEKNGAKPTLTFTALGQSQTGVELSPGVYGNFSNPWSENNPNGGYIVSHEKVIVPESKNVIGSRHLIQFDDNASVMSDYCFLESYSE